MRRRAGTHGTFIQAMHERLATEPALRGLTTRDPGDPSIALLDAWATVGDVLTFYQDRIAAEGYLRTATERRSIVELGRLVGYTPRPGVASTVYLAYTLEDSQPDAVEIPAGARAQSIPGPGELPQSFETSDALVARRDWNNLEVRTRRPPSIRLGDALTLAQMRFAGTNTGLAPGALLLLTFGTVRVLRAVATVEPSFEDDVTDVALQPVPPAVAAGVKLLAKFLEDAKGIDEPVVHKAAELRAEAFIGQYPAKIESWYDRLYNAAGYPEPPLDSLVPQLLRDLIAPVPAPGNGAVPVTDATAIVGELLRPSVPQAASGAGLGRSLASSLGPGSDAHAQLLIRFAPQLGASLYTALDHARVNGLEPELTSVDRFAVSASLFGAGALKEPKEAETTTPPPEIGRAALLPMSQWPDWEPAADESTTALFLERAQEGVLPGSVVVIQRAASRVLRTVTAATTLQRNAYSTSGLTTKLTLDKQWVSKLAMKNVRNTLVHAQTVRLPLADEPILDDVGTGPVIELARVYDGLTSGRWVILSGERADMPGVTGIRAAELAMVASVKHGYDPNRPGDQLHTTLTLATPTSYRYRRATLTIYGNVAKATHGETRTEALGAGDGSQALQAFALKQPPLTFVSAPTASGAESTLSVYVDDVRWRETDSLAAAGPDDRVYVTKTGDDAATTVVFGDGEHGARLPTGVENVRAEYRNGIGSPGNVRPEQVSLLVTRPLGVREVVNPLRASGGADAETRDQARENVPLAVTALDRLVSVRDYADFARTFAGIGKAAARRDGRVVEVTIAGAGDIPIDPASDLVRNLQDAFRDLGDPDVPVRLRTRTLVAAALSATIAIDPDRRWDAVSARVRATLLDRFGFQARALGRPLLQSEVVAAIQGVPGVAWLDVVAFGGIPETDDEGHLQTLEALAAAVVKLADDAPAERIEGDLTIFTPAVPDTLILNLRR
jgi:predicted phage baseplate assembly protein